MIDGMRTNVDLRRFRNLPQLGCLHDFHFLKPFDFGIPLVTLSNVGSGDKHRARNLERLQDRVGMVDEIPIGVVERDDHVPQIVLRRQRLGDVAQRDDPISVFKKANLAFKSWWTDGPRPGVRADRMVHHDADGPFVVEPTPRPQQRWDVRPRG
jgi:hypothetical protein